jgi:hypothetical protein
MNLIRGLLSKNFVVTSLTITSMLLVGLVLCYHSSFSFAQTYYPPTSNIYPYSPTSNIYPYSPTSNIYPYSPTSNIYPYSPTSNIYPYSPTSNIFPQSNTPFLGLAQFSSRQVSPWFPSVPAISCGLGKFSFNVLGVPDKGASPEEDELMAIKIIASNNGLIITDRDVSGLILVGEDNIEDNEGEDFDIKTLFNDCQTLMYSR